MIFINRSTSEIKLNSVGDGLLLLYGQNITACERLLHSFSPSFSFVFVYYYYYYFLRWRITRRPFDARSSIRIAVPPPSPLRLQTTIIVTTIQCQSIYCSTVWYRTNKSPFRRRIVEWLKIHDIEWYLRPLFLKNKMYFSLSLRPITTCRDILLHRTG